MEVLAVHAFRAEFSFLSNFHASPILYGGEVYPTAEHLFQALKTLDQTERSRIARLPSPGQAKRAGRRVELRPDWEQIKTDVMVEVVRRKFTQNALLRELLLATDDAELVEGNTWGDRFWGVCDGTGQNWLGRILMERRRLLRLDGRE